MADERRVETLRQAFATLYGSAPTRWFRAPGRVDLMGSHTDYNDGFVATMTLDRDTWLAIRPRGDRRVRIATLNLPGSAEFGLDAVERDPDVPWTDYLRGAAAVLASEGVDLAGFDGLLHSRVPFGSGLSSSAAIESVALLAFAAVSGIEIEPLRLALLGQRVENEFVGVACGILDQYTSVLGTAGHALLLDCRALISEAVEIAPELAVVICDTRAPRQLTGSEYDERRAQCEAGAAHIAGYCPDVAALRDVPLELFEAREAELDPVVARRCRFIIEENARVLRLAEALPTGDEALLGALYDASWVGANELFEIGAPSMSAMHRAMDGAPGLIARRQAGAGFGGCLVAIVHRGSVERFAEHVTREYNRATSIEPSVWGVEASAGACELTVD
ncbi:MAG: galactokinase [Chloroflexota bacterium]|jgi:galactokinase